MVIVGVSARVRVNLMFRLRISFRGRVKVVFRIKHLVWILF